MTNTLIGLAAAIVAVWPPAAQAQELSPEQVRLFYADQGYTNVAIVRYDPTAFPPEPDCRPTPVEIRS